VEDAVTVPKQGEPLPTVRDPTLWGVL